MCYFKDNIRITIKTIVINDNNSVLLNNYKYNAYIEITA